MNADIQQRKSIGSLAPYVSNPNPQLITPDPAVSLQNYGQSYNQLLISNDVINRQLEAEERIARTCSLVPDLDVIDKFSQKGHLYKESTFKIQLISIFMLCSISLGVGVFVLPSIFQQTGVSIGVLLLIGMAFMSCFTQLICIECAIHYKVKSFEELANSSLGQLGEMLLAFFMAISLLTGNCSHVQTVGQMLNDLITWYYHASSDTIGTTKTIVLYAIMLFFTTPWLFRKNLRSLSGVGTLSVCTVILTSISLSIYCFYKICADEIARGSDAPIYDFSPLTTAHFWSHTFWSAVPTFAFVFTSILELFPVFVELQHSDPKLAKPAIIISTIICTSLYIVVGVFVVITYGSNVESNSLSSVPKSMYWLTFLSFCLVVVIILLYPVINYPMVNAIEKLLNYSPSCRVEQTAIDNTEDTTSSVSINEASATGAVSFKDRVLKNRRSIISIIGAIVVISVDIAVTNLDDLFGLTGSLGLSFICYIFPSIIYIAMKWREPKSWRSLKFWACIGVALFATTIMIYSTIVIIMSIF